MYCMKCGTKLSDDARFCHNCGSTMLSAEAPSQNDPFLSRPQSRDLAIPLKRSEPAEVPVRQTPSVPKDRSIPLPHRGPEAAGAPEPEKKQTPPVQRAIARPEERKPAVQEPVPVPADLPLQGSIPAASPDADEISFTIPVPEAVTEKTPAMPQETALIPSAPETVPEQEEPELSDGITYTEPQQEPHPEEFEETPSETPVETVTPAETDAQTEILPEEQEAPAVPEIQEPQTDTVSPAETPAEQPPGKKEPVKFFRNKTALIAAAAAVVVLLAGIWYAFRIWPQKQFERFYAAGSAALEEFDYGTAAENLALAYKIRQDDPELNEKLYTAYSGVYDQKMADGDVEAAISARCGMIGLMPENDEVLRSSLGELYLTYVRTLLLDGRTEKASKAVTSAAEYLDQEGMEALEQLQGSFAQLSDFADRAAALADSGEHVSICTMIDEIKPQIIVCSDTASGRQPVVRVKDRAHQYVVFYRHSSGQYYVYYGDLSDEGDRQGSGSIYYDGRSTSKDMLYYYISGWENDKPNGQFSEHEFTGSRYTTETIYEGELKNGFFDGQVAITWGNSGVYYAEYNSGKVTVIEIDPETGRYIIAYNEAHDDFLSFPNDPSSSRFGVDFY